MTMLYFIIGCPRSGTYLVSNILDRSGAIAIPTETHFIPLFARYAFLFGDLRTHGARKRLVHAIYAFLDIWLTRAEKERNFDEIFKHSLLVTHDDIERIIQAGKAYGDLVNAIYACYAARKGVPYAGDKSAFFEHVPLELIDKAVAGRARFIHIVRDGRDVVLSWRKLEMGPENLAVGARAWRDHVAQKRLWGKRHPDRYCEVRYEDLLENPEREVRRICDFSGIEFRPEMLRFHEGEMAQAIANSSTHALLGKPIDASNREKWRSKMPAEDVAFFEWIAGQELADSGYPVMDGSLGGWAKARFAMRYLYEVARGVLSYRNARLILKNILPAVLLVFSALGIKVERLVNSRLWLSIESPRSRS